MKKTLVIDAKIAEQDETSGMVKFRISIFVNHPTGQFMYSADNIWFNIDSINSFCCALDNMYVSNNSISDLSSYFIMKINLENGQYCVSIDIFEPLMGVSETARFSCQLKVDYEIIKDVRNSFNLLT